MENEEEARWVRSDDARRNFRNLLNEVERDGAHITILRYDTPAAVIVPVEWFEHAKAALNNLPPLTREK